MWNYLWPVLVVIGANTFYNIAAKSTPQNVNSFASLVVTYLVAALLAMVLFFITSPNKNLMSEFSKINWTSIVFGIAIVALEFGYINLYRAGWKVSVGSLVTNIGLACVLLIVGVLLYKEVISLRQMIGMAICAVGLILISK
ncbi:MULTISPECIES: EamA family transporter [Clostridiaceae]|uniref:EamA family transporter n=1 Tax=Clostridium facile TaxID=2763035 RepID=A0ABR7IPG7_9CLOT|nr:MULTISPECIES: EamA family transporter [Clostridiaceae]MBC5787016.1 EamA family transporter [Clostridium facile]PWM98383.1 MAG: hypothetical protein DBX37_06965 [Massilioclostridium sp.]